MSNSIQSVQAANAVTQGQANAQPSKPAPQSAVPQDRVTISSAAQQALAKASSGDSDHDGH